MNRNPFDKQVPIDIAIKPNTYVRCDGNIGYSNYPNANTSFGVLENGPLYKAMCEQAGYLMDPDVKEFNFHICYGTVGNIKQNGKGGFGLRHILSIPDHHVHEKNPANQQYDTAIDKIMALLRLLFQDISLLHPNKYYEDIGLSWNHSKGKFVLVCKSPFYLGKDNYIACAFYADGDYDFSICTYYPISHAKFVKIKMGTDGIHTPILSTKKPALLPTLNKIEITVHPVSIPANSDINSTLEKNNTDEKNSLTNLVNQPKLSHGGYANIYKLLTVNPEANLIQEWPVIDDDSETDQEDNSATLTELRQQNLCAESNASKIVNIPKITLEEMKQYVRQQHSISAVINLQLNKFINYFSDTVLDETKKIRTDLERNGANIRNIDFNIITTIIDKLCSGHLTEYKLWHRTLENVETRIDNFVQEFNKTALKILNQFQDFINSCQRDLKEKLFDISTTAKKIVDKVQEYKIRPINFSKDMIAIIDHCLNICDEYSRACLLQKTDILTHEDSKSPYYSAYKLTFCLINCPKFMLTTQQVTRLDKIKERIYAVMDKIQNKKPQNARTKNTIKVKS